MAVALAPVPHVTAHHYDVDRYDELLLSLRGPEVASDTFTIAVEDEHTRYFWTLTPGPSVDPTDSVDHYAVAYVEVRHVGDDFIPCRGVVWTMGSTPKDLECDDLRGGHSYEITVAKNDNQASLDLWGHEPLVWPPAGGWNAFDAIPL